LFDLRSRDASSSHATTADAWSCDKAFELRSIPVSSGRLVTENETMSLDEKSTYTRCLRPVNAPGVT
jgi:hypothetical protein